MGLPVFYASEQEIDGERGQITISGPDARHLTRSLRAREGDCVIFGDGIGTLYRARLGSTMAEPVRCQILSVTYLQPERPQLVIFQAMSKNQAMDETIARAAESGASRVVPFVSRRSPVEAVKKSAARLERWRSIARESSKVARRAWPLDVRTPLPGPLDEVAVRTVGACILLWEGEERRSFAEALPEAPPRSIGMIVGPEGGLDESEVDVMRTLGARTASLGVLNIRTESAGSMAVAIARFHYGLLSPGADEDA